MALSSFGHHRWNVVIPVARLLVCLVWYSLVKSYKDLNTAKFQVIHELEEHLPVALFRYEWHVCDHGKGRKYRPLTHSERFIPLLLMLRSATKDFSRWVSSFSTPVSTFSSDRRCFSPRGPAQPASSPAKAVRVAVRPLYLRDGLQAAEFRHCFWRALGQPVGRECWKGL